jgi:hypothetical protein
VTPNTDANYKKESHDAVAVAAKIMISKIRKHIEQDQSSCCKAAMEIDID